MFKLIYGMAKFTNKSYGYGTRPKKFNREKFIYYLSKKFHTFECADRYINSVSYLSKIKNKKVHYKIDKIPIKKNLLEIIMKKYKSKIFLISWLLR